VAELEAIDSAKKSNSKVPPNCYSALCTPSIFRWNSCFNDTTNPDSAVVAGRQLLQELLLPDEGCKAHELYPAQSVELTRTIMQHLMTIEIDAVSRSSFLDLVHKSCVAILQPFSMPISKACSNQNGHLSSRNDVSALNSSMSSSWISCQQVFLELAPVLLGDEAVTTIALASRSLITKLNSIPQSEQYLSAAVQLASQPLFASLNFALKNISTIDATRNADLNRRCVWQNMLQEMHSDSLKSGCYYPLVAFSIWNMNILLEPAGLDSQHDYPTSSSFLQYQQDAHGLAKGTCVSEFRKQQSVHHQPPSSKSQRKLH